MTPLREAGRQLQNAIFYHKLEEHFERANHIIILLGTNLLETTTNAQIVSQLTTTAQMVRARYRKAKIHLGTLLPRVGPIELQQNAKIPLINAQLTRLAPKLNIQICNINKALTKGGLPKARNN